MLNRISISNFQSLRQVQLELGRLTVIVGPSSSGKTALMRALKALVSNVRGSSYVSNDAKYATISAEMLEGDVVLERGDGYGLYQIIIPGKEAEDYTKLGGNVPEDVTRLLRIHPFEDGMSLHFAGQFDRPFLLTESGTTVARVLGDLTNVSLLFGAAREANRRKLTFQSELKLRQADERALLEQLQEYRDLNQQRIRCEEAEQLLAQLVELEGTRARLQKATELAEQAQLALAATVVLEMPDIGDLETRVQQWHALNDVLRTKQSAYDINERASRELVHQQELERLTHEELHNVLIEAGECPTCGRGFDVEEDTRVSNPVAIR